MYFKLRKMRPNEPRSKTEPEAGPTGTACPIGKAGLLGGVASSLAPSPAPLQVPKHPRWVNITHMYIFPP